MDRKELDPTIVTELDRCVRLFQSVENPETCAKMLEYLAYELADDFLDGGQACSDAWQDKAAGDPWGALGKIADKCATDAFKLRRDL